MQQFFFFIFLTHTLQTSCEEFSNFFLMDSSHIVSRSRNDFFFSDGLNKFTHDFVETYSASKLVSQTRHTSLKDCSFFSGDGVLVSHFSPP